MNILCLIPIICKGVVAGNPHDSKMFKQEVCRPVVLGLWEIKIGFQFGYRFGYPFGSILEISFPERIPTNFALLLNQ
jgi:type III secretory pathway component EscT